MGDNPGGKLRYRLRLSLGPGAPATPVTIWLLYPAFAEPPQQGGLPDAGHLRDVLRRVVLGCSHELQHNSSREGFHHIQVCSDVSEYIHQVKAILFENTPQWCNVVHMNAAEENRERGRGTRKNGKSQRVSVSFTPEQYEYLARIARRKRVSIAWVVRDAVEQLVAEDAPLFRRSQP